MRKNKAKKQNKLVEKNAEITVGEDFKAVTDSSANETIEHSASPIANTSKHISTAKTSKVDHVRKVKLNIAQTAESKADELEQEQSTPSHDITKESFEPAELKLKPGRVSLENNTITDKSVTETAEKTATAENTAKVTPDAEAKTDVTATPDIENTPDLTAAADTASPEAKEELALEIASTRVEANTFPAEENLPEENLPEEAAETELKDSTTNDVNSLNVSSQLETEAETEAKTEIDTESARAINSGSEDNSVTQAEAAPKNDVPEDNFQNLPKNGFEIKITKLPESKTSQDKSLDIEARAAEASANNLESTEEETAATSDKTETETEEEAETSAAPKEPAESETTKTENPLTTSAAAVPVSASKEKTKKRTKFKHRLKQSRNNKSERSTELELKKKQRGAAGTLLLLSSALTLAILLVWENQDIEVLGLTRTNLDGALFIRLLIYLLALFIPALLVYYLYDIEPERVLGKSKQNSTSYVLTVVSGILLAIIYIGINNFSIFCLDKMGANPGYNNPLLVSETPSWIGIVLNILVIGILPAVIEEFMFRGVMQTALLASDRIHLSILLTATAASLFTQNLVLILAPLALAVYLGYVKEKSDNLGVTVVLHIVTNLTIIALQSFMPLFNSTVDLRGSEGRTNFLISVIFAVVAVVIMFPLGKASFRSYKDNVNGQNTAENEVNGSSKAKRLRQEQRFPVDWKYMLAVLLLLLKSIFI